MNRVIQSAVQLEAGYEMDSKYKRMGGSFGAIDFLRYSMFGRSLEHSLTRDAEFYDNNPIVGDKQKQDMLESKYIASPGVNYNIPGSYKSSTEIKNKLRQDENLWKNVEILHNQAIGNYETDSVQEHITESIGKLDNWMDDNELLLRAVAFRDPGAMTAWKEGVDPDEYQAPSHKSDQGSATTLEATKKTLRRLVTRYYANGCKMQAIDQYLNGSKRSSYPGKRIEVSYTWPNKQAVSNRNDGVTIKALSEGEQGFEYAIQGLLSRINSRRLDDVKLEELFIGD